MRRYPSARRPTTRRTRTSSRFCRGILALFTTLCTQWPRAIRRVITETGEPKRQPLPAVSRVLAEQLAHQALQGGAQVDGRPRLSVDQISWLIYFSDPYGRAGSCKLGASDSSAVGTAVAVSWRYRTRSPRRLWRPHACCVTFRDLRGRCYNLRKGVRVIVASAFRALDDFLENRI